MPFRKRTNAYWEKRVQEQLTHLEQQALPYIKQIDVVFRNAQKTNLAAVKQLYVNYYKSQGWDTSALKQIAPRGDIRRFQDAVVAAGLSDRLPDGYGFRLNRLELLEAQMWLEVHKAAIAQQTIQTTAHISTTKTAYDYSQYVLAKGTGVAPVFSKLNDKAVNQILKSKFYGKNYSDRIWSNSGKLAKDLKGILAESVATGQSQTKTARLIRERYGVKRFEATRLISTETNHFNTMATDRSYTDIGIEEWVYIATLDSRTSDDCGIHDGKRYPINGGPSIPLHPMCRCTKRAYLGKEYEPDERIMRDQKTGENRYIGNISYDQWNLLHKS